MNAPKCVSDQVMSLPTLTDASGHGTEPLHHSFRYSCDTNALSSLCDPYEMDHKAGDLSLPAPHLTHVTDFGFQYDHQTAFHSQHHLHAPLEHPYAPAAGLYYSMNMDAMPPHPMALTMGRGRDSQNSFDDQESVAEASTWELDSMNNSNSRNMYASTSRKSKKRGGASSVSNASDGDDNEDKRKKFLERNRLAGMLNLIRVS